MPFESLDYLYMPSRDVASDLAYARDVLGVRVIFAIDSDGTRVAMLELTDGPPRLVLADHLDGDSPILVYRVDDLPAEVEGLKARGQQRTKTLEIPQGPCSSFRTPAGQRFALYQLTRPEVLKHFEGRLDF